MKLQIAIDGPGGAGKSTVAKEVARRLGLFYLDTGAMYRALAYMAIKQNLSLDQEKDIEKLAKEITIEFDHSDWGKVWCNGEDVTEAIRTPEVSRAVSIVAAYPSVRHWMVRLQQLEAQKGGVVMDGRDIGTHVMPQADLKIFLTASPEERAKRRWLELKSKGKPVTLEEVMRDLTNRDRIDTERASSPLRPADDALIIDTTGKSIDQVVEEIVKLAKGRIQNEVL